MKLKKIFALVLASAMIMGSTVTTFAAGNTATITINNYGETTVKYLRIIVPDPQAKTGWSFASPAIEEAYLEDFENPDAQTVIQNMINGNVSASDISNALENVKNMDNIDDLLDTATDSIASDGKFTFNVDDAGVYYIQGVDRDAYTYSPMAAYVSFGEDSDGAYDPTQLKDAAPIEAKGEPEKIEKTPSDDVVEIGREVEYTISSVIPYLDSDTDEYKITDTITGATYKRVSGEEKVSVEIYIGKNVADINEETEPNGTENVAITSGTTKGTETFTINLNKYLSGNANKNIVLKYSAVVTDIEVNNTVTVGNGDNNFATDIAKVDTATITLTKTGDKSVLLEGAKFVVRNTKGKYATFTQEDGAYILKGWTDDYKVSGDAVESDKDGFVDATVVKTNGSGNATIKGLDEKTDETYTFVEVEAPDGYSIADASDNVIWTDNTTGTITIVDTKLSALPSTGGIGTTIFTIGGCVIMISAAGLYFASRRKQENK